MSSEPTELEGFTGLEIIYLLPAKLSVTIIDEGTEGPPLRHEGGGPLIYGKMRISREVPRQGRKPYTEALENELGFLISELAQALRTDSDFAQRLYMSTLEATVPIIHRLHWWDHD